MYLEIGSLGRLKILIKVKRSHRGGALIQQNWCPFKERKGLQRCLFSCVCTFRTQGKKMLSMSYKESSHQNPTPLAPWSRTSSLQNFQPPGLWWSVVESQIDGNTGTRNTLTFNLIDVTKIILRSSAPLHPSKGLPGVSVGKEFACNAVDLSSIPGSGRSLKEGNGNPFQCACLGNPMDRGAWSMWS